MTYAEVILPLPLYSTFTYSIPDNLQSAVGVGFRVLVPFGRKKFYTGIVTMLHNQRPGNYEVKDIVAVLDNDSILRHPQMKFWQWISDYYLCPVGEVYKAAVPAGMKVESETRVSANPDFIDTDGSMTERETVVYDMLLAKERLTPAEIAKATGYKSVETVVARLIDKEAVFVTEKIVDNYRPKTEVCVALRAEKGDNKTVEDFFSKVKQAKKQEAALLAYLDLSGWMKRNATPKEVTKDALIKRAEVSLPIINAMVAKGIFSLYKKEVNRFHLDNGFITALNPLSEPQQKAYDEIIETFKEQNITLLHGVTSSGKTEIYTHLIDNALKRGLQALYLVPEIALTTQLTQRLHKNFGDRLLIYHSKFSDNERVDIWKKLLHSNEPCVVIGVRSSVFLPFGKLGIVIVDEEHETSYKQQDPAPRYNARDAALILASMHGAKTLLGSATPSIQTYYKAESGKYGLVNLSTRFEGVELPAVRVIDTKQSRKRKEMRGAFTKELVNECNDAIARGEQAIIFQNRRGFAPMIECRGCGWVPRCVNCDVSLTYHKAHNQLVCHYCGYTYRLPQVCPECKGTEFKMQGFGTEKVEEEIAGQFPAAKVERLDFDTARTRTAYERIISDFEKGKTQILIGTQMLSKGLDFGNVSVVGILSADSLMNFPDFRAHERAYQLMVQVSGRAGRRDKRGTVILQTTQPEHPLIRMVQHFAYKEMVSLQLSERSMFRYPPYYRLIVLILRSRNEEALQEMSALYAEKLRARLGERVLGPVTPPITRVQTLHIKKIVLKIEISAGIAPLREILEGIHAEMQGYALFKQLLVHYDVDPA